jgi:hypothetical protein
MTGPTWGGMPHRNARHDPCTKETKQSWDLGHPPQKRERAVWVHVGFTLLLRPGARISSAMCARGPRGEDIGGLCWGRQLWEPIRAPGLVCAPGDDGLVHLAEDSRRRGVKRQEVPPDRGHRQQVLAKLQLPAGGELLP